MPTATADPVVGGKHQRSAEPKAPCTKRHKTFWTPQVNQDGVTAHVARWLIRDGGSYFYFDGYHSVTNMLFGLSYNTITTLAFREFLSGTTGNPDVTVPSHHTYNDILDNSYESFQKVTKSLLLKEFNELHGTPFITLEHDLCTNKAKATIVDASCGFIDHQWRPRKLALLAQVKNDGHDSEGVENLLDVELKQRYGLDVEKMARFTISDTASAARKISKQFDSTLQTDCLMHALNLCIGYGIGLKENVRNMYTPDPNDKEGKVYQEESRGNRRGCFSRRRCCYPETTRSQQFFLRRVGRLNA
ncbi:hypothetical protein V7S43_007146 [Phytophthora oleae]|uniref:DUF659 domain-containing protein n=1 Tax=Phytophthora oleae TaxID=2107226 RepID=A0ABD3FL13_9STRA